MSRRTVRLTVLLTLTALACRGAITDPGARLAPEVREYVDTAFNFTQSTFYYGSRVDWNGLRTRTYDRARDSHMWSDAWPALDTMARDLNDRHTFFFRPTQTAGTTNAPADVAFYRAMSKSFVPRVSYVWMPMYIGTNQVARADSIQAAIAAVDVPGTCGWIVDLRGNPGGFWATMLAGMSPLLREGVVGGFVERDTTHRYLYEVHPGSAGLRTYDGTYFEDIRLTHAYSLSTPGLPIAVLQGPITASAGEIMVMAFRDATRPIRTFGAPTYGATSQPYTKLLFDFASLQVTAALMFDRAGHTFPNETIAPDESVTGPAIGTSYVPGAATDAVIDAATAWLKTQTACTQSSRTQSSRTRAQRAEGPAVRWTATRAVQGAVPSSSWPKGRPTPWKAGG